MTRRAIFVRLLGVILAVVGSMLWNSRLTWSPESVLQKQFGDQLTLLDSDATTDLSKACNVFTDAAPWVLFVLDAQLANDNVFRTYFETSADERQALWVEYDPPLLRVGLGLGLENPVSNTDVPVRVVRRDEAITVVIAVQEAGTRVVSNATNARSDWPGVGGGGWRCDALRVGSDSVELSAGNTCGECNVRLRYAFGDDQQQLDQLLDDLNNIGRFNLLRWLGTALTLLGAVSIVAPTSWLDRRYMKRATTT